MSPELDVVELYRTFFPILLRKCQRMLGDGAAAQDVAQETFARLWRHRARLTEPRAIVGWLYTTSTRIAVDRLRCVARDVPDAPARVAASGPGPERIAAARDLLRQVVGSLDPADLELLVLARLDGLQQREIADLLGSSERTVRRRLADLDRHLQTFGADHG